MSFICREINISVISLLAV